MKTPNRFVPAYLTPLALLGLFSALAIAALQPGTVVEPHDATSQPTTAPATQPAKKYTLRYKLSDGHENWPADKRKAIIDAMDGAVALYNEIGEFDKLVTANWSPGTPTADANYDGWINFGGQIGQRTALHEIGHTLGVGTIPQWREHLVDGKWTGSAANALVKTFDGPDAIVHGDRQHFWPYGLNFDKESSPENQRRHVRMVAALRQDMGIENGIEQRPRERRRPTTRLATLPSTKPAV